jgi:Type II/IV secretion system protein
MPAVPSDFTFHQNAGQFTELCKRLADHAGESTEKPPASDAYSRACTLAIPLVPPPTPPAPGERPWPDPFTARVLACRCFAGEHVSVTCRDLGASAAGPASATSTVRWPGDAVDLFPPAGQPDPPVAGEEEPALEQGTDPLPVDEEKIAQKQSTEQMVGALWRMLRLDDHPVTGLIVIAGRTGSGKSAIARAFIERYLADCARKRPERRPHLVTYEDPIEHRFAASPRDAVRRGFDYTPREKGIDVNDLKDATMDALRQTPALFFVGETREAEDWKTLLHFAGTGHLAITTGHAGSLVETMAQIAQAVEVRTPSERSRVAGRIAALVHIRPYWPRNPGVLKKVLIPAFWSRTPRSMSAFTAEGLGSMLPNQPRPSAAGGARAGDDSDYQPPGSYGRAYAVEMDYLRDIAELKRKSIEWDLRGE